MPDDLSGAQAHEMPVALQTAAFAGPPKSQVRPPGLPFHFADAVGAERGQFRDAALLAVSMPAAKSIGPLRTQDEPAIEQDQVIAAGTPGEWTGQAHGMQIDQEHLRMAILP